MYLQSNRDCGWNDRVSGRQLCWGDAAERYAQTRHRDQPRSFRRKIQSNYFPGRKNGAKVLARVDIVDALALVSVSRHFRG